MCKVCILGQNPHFVEKTHQTMVYQFMFSRKISYSEGFFNFFTIVISSYRQLFNRLFWLIFWLVRCIGVAGSGRGVRPHRGAGLCCGADEGGCCERILIRNIKRDGKEQEVETTPVLH